MNQEIRNETRCAGALNLFFFISKNKYFPTHQQDELHYFTVRINFRLKKTDIIINERVSKNRFNKMCQIKTKLLSKTISKLKKK
jgi:hypothetical protein